MSYTALQVIADNGDVLGAEKYKNSHRGASLIWTQLCVKYKIFNSLGYPHYEAWKELWERVHSKEIKLEWFENNVLYFTYDYALVRRDDMQQLAASLRFFNKHHQKEYLPHWVYMAQDIEVNHKEGFHGVGLYVTSVSDNLWSVYDEEKNSYRPYNINVDDKHWYVRIR